MKATTWLCPVFTLLCATKLVYTAQRESYGGYAFDDIDSQNLQNDYFRSKRNKPSLSIVNPLDVLRQRLLLEIARRQMKENSRQVELNRAILKNVGKRMASKYSSPLTAALYDVNESQQQRQQQQQQQMRQDLLQHLPATYEYELMPTTLIFDYLQKQQQQQQQQQQAEQPHYSWLPYAANALQFDNNYINDAIDGSSDGQLDNSDEDDAVQDEVLAINGLLGGSGGHSLKHLKQTNNEHSNTANEQQQQQQHDKTTFQKSINNRADDDTKRLSLIKNHQSHHQNSQSTGNSNSNSNNNNNLNLDLNDANPLTSSNPNENDFKNELNVNGDGDYQIQRYLYHLHKNHLTRK